MTYLDLLNDLSMEVGDRPDVVARLPQFIRSIEDDLWPRLEGFATVGKEVVAITADATEATISDAYWMRILGCYDEDGNTVERVGYARMQQLQLEESCDECEYFAWNKTGTLYVADAPSTSTSLTLVYLAREEPMTGTCSATDRFFLGDGYNLIKYAVLTYRVFDRDKWGAWKQQYDRELHNLYVRSQKQALTYKGDDGRRWL